MLRATSTLYTCSTCMAPHQEVPDLMGLDDAIGCYFRWQPQTPEELDHAIEAVSVSCLEVLRYSGNNPAILEGLRAKGCKSQSDVL